MFNLLNEARDTSISVNSKRKARKESREKIISKIKLFPIISHLLKECKKYSNWKFKRTQKRYDKTTLRYIEKIPDVIRGASKRGKNKVIIHTYYRHYIAVPFLSYELAIYHLDRRGKDIIKYLEEQGFRTSLIAHNGVVDSCYCIEVLW
ncbi:hypothetical protein D3C81_1807010 [compost metagenome]